MARRLIMNKSKCLNIFFNMCFLFLLTIFFLTINLYSSDSDHFLNYFQPHKSNSLNIYNQILETDISCKKLHNFDDSKAKCSYVKIHRTCQTGGYIAYLQLFYCSFGPVLGYPLLILWLLILFYLLGDTASNYFCSSLEGLSRILKLSPTIAGATLLSLGNGAPDLFSSIISFMGDGTKDVGLNSILGGGFFVTTIVVGIISFSVCSHGNTGVFISKSSFIRDVVFFLLSISCLLIIIIFGKINLWGALSFLSLYFIYIALVSASQIWGKKNTEVEAIVTSDSQILPVSRSLLVEKVEGSTDLGAPLLVCLAEEKGRESWCNLQSSATCCCGKVMYNILVLPLYLPRRLTIPVVSEERWSKPFAVISATIAPVLLAFIWNFNGSKSSFLIYEIGGSVGIINGLVVYFTTDKSNPPRKCLFPWLAGGFLMSITWTYTLAQEMIALLVSIGLISGINPSILGLTVLAWGNSLGDLVANVAIAKNGGPTGAQISMSGCYAGPIFNTAVGLGLSLCFSAWTEYPSSYIIEKDPFVYETLGFLMGGLLWAIVILPMRKMRPDRFLGGGLIAIYLCFLFLNMARTLGFSRLSTPRGLHS